MDTNKVTRCLRRCSLKRRVRAFQQRMDQAHGSVDILILAGLGDHNSLSRDIKAEMNENTPTLLHIYILDSYTPAGCLYVVSATPNYRVWMVLISGAVRCDGGNYI